MDKVKEGIGLHINCDGPDGGKYYRNGAANLVLKAPPVGTPHFTNWDSGLTSLENTTKERFESRVATRFLDDYMSTISDQKIRFGAKDIKIVDNLAAISYPNFTDINKSTSTLLGSSVLSYMIGAKDNSYDYTCINWSEVYPNHVLLPQIDLSTLTSPYSGYPSFGTRFNPSFDGLYIVLEYNGNYTKADANPCNPAATFYDSTLDNKRQILVYNPDVNALEPGDYTVIDFAPGGNTSQSKQMVLAYIGHSLDIGPVEFFTPGFGSIGEQVYGFGKIECDVHLIKYKPVIECGKIDLYTKKRGDINSYSTQGKLVSIDHNLKNGDIIKISNANNSTINGVKYVQVIDDSNFIIYKDAEFTEREMSYYEGSPTWTACGNVYDEESQSWDYLGTLTSPEGRNGYAYERTTTHDISTFYKSSTIDDYFADASSMNDLVLLDFEISSVVFANFKQFPVVSGVPTRSTTDDALFSAINFRESRLKANDVFSPLDTYWTNCNNYLQGFRFGESIDLVKYENRYILAVGEPGLNTIPDLSAHCQLPVNPVYGKVFLFDIYMDANGQITDPSDDPDRPISFNSKYYAYTNDSSIDEPPYLTPDDNESGFYRPLANFLGQTTFNYYYGSLTHTTTGFSDSDSVATQKSDRFFDFSNLNMTGDPDLFRRIEYKTKMEYWYGAMVYHLTDLLRDGGENNPPIDTAGLDYTTGGCRDAYFTDLKVPKFLSNTSIVYSAPPTYYHRNSFWTYPYIDEFGKAIAISVDNSDLYLFASSTVKPVVERPDYDGSDLPSISIGLGPVTCENADLAKTQCGYIHVFKNGSKIQKIYEDGYSLPSGGWRGFYYKSQKFATCIRAFKDKLVFGQPKPIDYYSSPSTSIETSKIFIYTRVGGLYYKSQEVANDNNLTFSFPNTISFPDQKEYFLRDGNEFIVVSNGSLTGTDLDGLYYHPSDRFGSYFKYNEDLLVTNAFDVYNEAGEYHGSLNSIYLDRSNEFNRPIDYLHVYENRGGTFTFVKKIAPSFDRYDASYMYETLLGPNVYNSIRAVGNINYSNNDSNSRTWDIDLTGCYDLVNNRILLKDPMSYSVFEKSINPQSNSYPISLTLNKYFTYDEKYEAEETLSGSCDLIFDRISAIHKYDNYLDDYRNLYQENRTSSRKINYRAPVYFINIPINSSNIAQVSSINITVEEVRSLDAGVNLQLVLFKRDPRTTVYPFYSSLCSSTPSLDAAKKWSSSVPYANMTFLAGGVFDSSNYADTSSGSIFDPCSGSSCMSILIPASSITVSGSRRDYVFTIDNSLIDINNYLTSNSLILDSSDNRTLNTENIEFDDLANIGYDSGIDVESSFIVGFIYQAGDYKINSNFNSRGDVRIVDITMNGTSYLPASPTSDFDYTYSCVFNKVASLDYYRQYYNNPVNKVTVSEIDGKIVYTNPIIAAGLTRTASFNDTRDGQIGAFCNTYEILSVDNFGTTPETSIFGNTRSLDIQNLEYLPMFLEGTDSNPYINLFMKVAEGDAKQLNLFLQNTASSGVFPLNIKSSLSSSGIQNLWINASYFDSGNINTHMVGAPFGYTSLFMKVADPSSNAVNLRVAGYGFESGNFPLYINTKEQLVIPLFMKSLDAEDLNGSTNLFVYGNNTSSSFTNNSADLFISVYDDSRQSIDSNSPLFIQSPSTFTQNESGVAPLYISNVLYNNSGVFNSFIFGGFGGNFTVDGGYLGLFTKNTGVFSSGSMPLILPVKGFNNSDTLENSTNLFLKQNQEVEYLTLFVDPSTGISNAVNLFMPSGNGVLSSGIGTFIRGYNS